MKVGRRRGEVRRIIGIKGRKSSPKLSMFSGRVASPESVFVF